MTKRELISYLRRKGTTAIWRDTTRVADKVQTIRLFLTPGVPVPEGTTWDEASRTLWLGEPSKSNAFVLDTFLTLSQVKSAYVQHVVSRLGGDKAAAAEALGIDVKTIYNYLHQGKINV